MSNFNFNKVILGGRLTADVELKQTPQGVSVCQFSIAINRRIGKEQEQQADFINCVAWRNTAEFISKYFKKGSSICVSGSLQVRSWTDGNGNKKFAREVKVDDAYFVDGKNESEAQEPTPSFTEIDHEDDFPF